MPGWLLIDVLDCHASPGLAERYVAGSAVSYALLPGRYGLVFGLYDADTLERISIEGSLMDNYGAIVLGDVEVG
jgi:hypothetical protein